MDTFKVVHNNYPRGIFLIAITTLKYTVGKNFQQCGGAVMKKYHANLGVNRMKSGAATPASVKHKC